MSDPRTGVSSDAAAAGPATTTTSNQTSTSGGVAIRMPTIVGSAPVPMAPFPRPSIPKHDPPAITLPPSVPNSTIIDDETRKILESSIRAQGGDSKSDAIREPAALPMGKSLTNATFKLAGTPLGVAANQDGEEPNLPMGRSPTIFGLMSGTEPALVPSATSSGMPQPFSMGSRADVPSSRNPAFRGVGSVPQSISGGPPVVAGGRPLGRPPHDDDEDEEETDEVDEEDEDEEIETHDLPLDDDLQFNHFSIE